MIPFVGVSIAVHNGYERTRECLTALYKSENVKLHIVVVDDGSTDGTSDLVAKEFPQTVILAGDGDLWWTKGTNLGIKACLETGCDFVLLLNPDVLLEKTTISQLVSVVRQTSNTIVGSVVVSHDNPDKIWWSGSIWSPLARYVPFIWTNRYLFKQGTPISVLPTEPFRTSEVHGRAVLVPRFVFDKLGLYDSKSFPHYGADTDFSFRATEEGFILVVDPNSHVQLHTENTGMRHSKSLGSAWQSYWLYLTNRKNGEAIFVWWRLTQRHLSPFSAIASFMFIIALNTFRYWATILRGIK